MTKPKKIPLIKCADVDDGDILFYGDNIALVFNKRTVNFSLTKRFDILWIRWHNQAGLRVNNLTINSFFDFDYEEGSYSSEYEIVKTKHI